jgi:hypothetical protein
VIGKVADMQMKSRAELAGSPVPGVIPEPVRVRHDTVVSEELLTAEPRASGTTERSSSRSWRNPVRGVIARLRSAFGGDEYLADAHPPPGRSAAAARAGDEALGQTHDGDVAVDVQSPAEPERDTAGHAPAAAPQTKER